MATLKTNFWTYFKEYALITLGIVLYTAGWVIFLIPNNLVGGGVTGISSIIQYATGIKMGFTYLVLNAILLAMAMFFIGFGFGGKTVYAIVLASFLLNFFQTAIPPTIIEALALNNGKLMSTIMGGIMAGAGIGMAISEGGSTGGTDILALIVNKYRNVSPGRMILVIDLVIIGSSILVPSYSADGKLVPFVDKVLTVVYGYILVSICSVVIDQYLSGSKQSVQLIILSKKYEAIADAITRDLHRGVTVLDGQGWYTKEPSHVLMVLTRKTDMNLLFKYIKTIDPEVFMSVSSVMGVYGRGFDTIKVKTSESKDSSIS
jgi:uncharacterized membrane-anchored protein YitT (DUF2179 family)